MSDVALPVGSALLPVGCMAKPQGAKHSGRGFEAIIPFGDNFRHLGYSNEGESHVWVGVVLALTPIAFKVCPVNASHARNTEGRLTSY